MNRVTLLLSLQMSCLVFIVSINDLINQLTE